MTIHGSKLELEWPRYHENRVNAPIDARLTSGSHNFWSDCWTFKFHTFLETRSQNISRGFKIKPVRGGLQVAAFQGLLRAPPCNPCRGYKRPKAPLVQKKKKKTFLGLALYLDVFYMLPLSSKHIFTQKHPKNKSKPLDSSLRQKYKVLFLYPTFFPLILHLGFEV